jgi:prepilin-type N-terminal cleavage/methylation domain-containing protein
MKKNHNNSQSGFTLLELMIVMAVFLVVMAAVLLQSRTVTQRAAAERNQMDIFQEAREFMDQMSRDLRQIGYPNSRNFYHTVLNNGGTQDPTTSTLAAVGLVKAGSGDLYFEGGVDEASGNVLYTQYSVDTSTTGNCPCLKRSQQFRAATPGSETPSWSTEVQNVQNASDPNNPIFRYYMQGGLQEISASNIPVSGATFPVTWDATGATPNNEVLAMIDTIKITLVVQSPYADSQTRVKPIITLVSTVRVNNCSQATTGQLSCAN